MIDRVYVAVSETDAAGTDLKVFFNKKEARKEITSWFGEDVLSFVEDILGAEDDKEVESVTTELNKFLNDVECYRDSDGNISGIYGTDFFYYIVESEIE